MAPCGWARVSQTGWTCSGPAWRRGLSVLTGRRGRRVGRAAPSPAPTRPPTPLLAPFPPHCPPLDQVRWSAWCTNIRGFRVRITRGGWTRASWIRRRSWNRARASARRLALRHPALAPPARVRVATAHGGPACGLGAGSYRGSSATPRRLPQAWGRECPRWRAASFRGAPAQLAWRWRRTAPAPSRLMLGQAWPAWSRQHTSSRPRLPVSRARVELRR